MSSINKADLLAAARVYKRERVEIPGFPEVFARELSGLERQAHFRVLNKAETEADEVKAAAKMVVCVLVDGAGDPVLTEADLPEVEKWPARMLNAVNSASNKAGEFDPKKPAGSTAP